MGVRQFQNIDASLIANVAAEYRFDGNLVDSGPNGLDLSVTLGNPRSVIVDALQGVYLDGGVRLARPGHDAELALDEDLTIHMLALPLNNATSITDHWVRFENPAGGAEADNALYRVTLTASGTGRDWQYESHSGAHVLQTTDFEVGCPPGNFRLFSLTRSAAAGGNQTVNWYIDGALYSGPHTATQPTGGSQSFLEVFEPFCIFGGLVIAATEQTPQQIAEVFESVLL